MNTDKTNYFYIRLRHDFKNLMQEYSNCTPSLEACYTIITVLIDDMISLGYDYEDIRSLMLGYIQSYEKYNEDTKNKIVYVYKEYDSKDPYTLESICVYSSLFMARQVLKYRVEKFFNKKWDEIKRDITSGDVLTEDFVKINKDGHFIYFIIEGGFAV